jgi:hypothetical protein
MREDGSGRTVLMRNFFNVHPWLCCFGAMMLVIVIIFFFVQH